MPRKNNQNHLMKISTIQKESWFFIQNSSTWLDLAFCYYDIYMYISFFCYLIGWTKHGSVHRIYYQLDENSNMAEHGLLHGNIPGLGICKFHFRIKQLLLLRIGRPFPEVRKYSGEEPLYRIPFTIVLSCATRDAGGFFSLNSISSTEMTSKLQFRPDRVDRTCQCAPPFFKRQRERLKQKEHEDIQLIKKNMLHQLIYDELMIYM